MLSITNILIIVLAILIIFLIFMVIYLFKSDRDSVEYTNFDAFNDTDHVQPDIAPSKNKLQVSETAMHTDFAVDDEQDPAELAQSYIEQKKYPQAVGVLNKAIEKHSERSDLYLMLLGILAIEKDKESFETMASQLGNVSDDANVLSQVMQLREVLDEQLASSSAVVAANEQQVEKTSTALDAFDFDTPATDTTKPEVAVAKKDEEDFFDFSSGDQDFDFTPADDEKMVGTSQQDLDQEIGAAIEEVQQSESGTVLADESTSFDFDDWDTPTTEQTADAPAELVLDESTKTVDVEIEQAKTDDVAAASSADDDMDTDVFADFDFDSQPALSTEQPIEQAEDKQDDSFDDLFTDEVDVFDVPAVTTDEQPTELASAPVALDIEQNVDSTPSESDADIFDVEFDFEEETTAVKTQSDSVTVDTVVDVVMDDDIFATDFDIQTQTTIETTATQNQADSDDIFDFADQPDQQASDFEETKVFVDLENDEPVADDAVVQEQEIAAQNTTQVADTTDDVFDFDDAFAANEIAVDTAQEKIAVTSPVSDQSTVDSFTDDVFDFGAEAVHATEVDVATEDTKIAGEEETVADMVVSPIDDVVVGSEDDVFDLDFDDDDGVGIDETPVVQATEGDNKPVKSDTNDDVLDFGQDDMDVELDIESAGTLVVDDAIVDDIVATEEPVDNVSSGILDDAPENDDILSFDGVASEETVSGADFAASTETMLATKADVQEPVEQAVSLAPATSADNQEHFVSTGFEDTISQLDALYATPASEPTEATPIIDDVVAAVDTDAVQVLDEPEVADDVVNDAMVASTSTDETVAEDSQVNLAEDVVASELNVVEEMSNEAVLTDLDDFSVEIDEEFTADTKSEVSGVEGAQQDVALNTEQQPVAQPTQPTVATPAKTLVDEPVLDLSTLDKTFDFIKDIDEQQTTLELANQYVTLGEYDSAKRLLQEVMSIGNSDQKRQAQTLLARIN